MFKIVYLLCILEGTILLRPVESDDFYDYDNKIYDYYRQESSNQNNVQAAVLYDCKSEGFHPDPNDCRIFYRCVEWGNGSPLTPFKFECGVDTVFSPSKGNVCVHPNDSGRSECCEPSNEIDSNESSNSSSSSSSSSSSWSQEPELENHYPSSPSSPYPSYIPQTEKPEYPGHPSQTQKPNYPSQTQRPVPNYTSQSLEPQEINHPLTTQYPQHPSYPSHSDRPGNSHCNGLHNGSCGSSIGCTDEGFFPNPENCHKFYRCVNEGSSLKRYDFTCGTGTAWDQTLQTCNFENNVVNCGADLESGNSQPPPDSGSQISNSGTSSTSSITQASQSQWSNTTNSLSQSTQTPIYPSYLPPQSTQSPYPPVQVTQQSTQSTNPSSLLTHGTVNPIQKPYPSTNAPEYIPPPPVNTTSQSGNNTIEAPGTGGKPCAPNGSSKDCHEEGFFANAQDCHKFYRCVNEDGSFHKYDFECGTGTAWDQELQTCNHENAINGCGMNESGTHLPDFDSSPVSNNPGIGAGPQDQNPNSTPGNLNPPNIQSSQTTVQPNNEVQNTSQLSTTLSTQTVTEVTQPLFVPTSQITNKPEISNNPSSITQSQITTQSIQSTTQASSQLQTSSSPNQGNQSTANSNINEPQHSSNSKCEGDGFFANPNDCRKFYRCVSNPPGYIKYEFDCAPGTAWDQSLLTCNYIHEVTTCNLSQNQNMPNQSSPSENSSTLPTSHLPSVTQSSTTMTNNKPSSQQSLSTGESSVTPIYPGTASSTSPATTEENNSDLSKPDCNTPKPNNTIVCNNTGFYPHPNRCDKFYRCVDNGKGFNIYYFDCPVGTIFDPSIEVCNYPESVYPARNCENVESQGSTTSQSQSSTTQVTTSSAVTSKPTKPLSKPEINSERPPGSSGSLTTTSSSEATIPSSEATTPSSEATTPSSEGMTPSSEATTPNSEATTPSSEGTTSISETTTSNTEILTSTSDATTSNTEILTSTSDATTSSTIITTTNSDLTTPTTESTISNSDATTSTSELTPSTSITTVTDSEATTSISDGTTLSSEPTTPTSESTTGSETSIQNSEGTTSVFETTAASTEMSTSASEITTPNLESTTQPGEYTTASSLSTQALTTESSDTTVTTSDITSSTQQQSTTNAEVQETTTVSSGTTDSQASTTISSSEKPTDMDCPVPANLTDDQVVLICPTGFRRHPKLCNLFYQCTMSGNTEVKILILQCPEGTIFDEKTNKCLPESESSQSCKGKIVGKRIQRGVNNELISTIEVSRKPLCPEEGHFPYRDGCSNIFYKCGRNSRYDLEGYLFKCPKDFVYWSVSRRCERALRLPTCTRMSSDTENENEAWENRWEIPVEDRNLSARSLFSY